MELPRIDTGGQGPQASVTGNTNSVSSSDTSGFLEAAGFDACDHMTAVRKECT